jgi:hypothetical protein
MLNWNIFEINATTLIHGVMLRGRIRKYALVNDISLLIENASDKENCVRFAINNLDNIDVISTYIQSIVSDAKIELILEAVNNPVLSKLKVNIESRYEV